MSDINITIKDRDGHIHKILAPTDMAMNIMEIVRSYELAPEGTIGSLWWHGYVCLLSMLCSFQTRYS